jgi:hypothetical protein
VLIRAGKRLQHSPLLWYIKQTLRIQCPEKVLVLPGHDHSVHIVQFKCLAALALLTVIVGYGNLEMKDVLLESSIPQSPPINL